MKRLFAAGLLALAVGCHEPLLQPVNEAVATDDAGHDAGIPDAGPPPFVEGMTFHAAPADTNTLFEGVAFDAVGMIAVGSVDRDALAVRVLFDGGVDPNFSTAGAFRFDGAMGLDDSAEAVAVAPNGRIAIVGKTTERGRQEFLVLQLLSDGTRDAAFGVAGQVSLDLGAPGVAHGVAFQPDGKLVVVGQVWVPSLRAVIVRLLPDGRPDPDFGVNGSVRLDTALGDGAATAVAVLADGHIVASGFTIGGTGSLRPMVVRLSPTGALDPSFANDGVFQFEPTLVWVTGEELAVRPDGSMVVLILGKLFGLTAAGALDQEWGSDGIVDLDASFQAHAVALGPNGTVLLAGGVYLDPLRVRLEVATARLTARGLPDVTFGAAGLRRTGERGGVLSGLAAQPDGRAAAVGATAFGSVAVGLVVRFLN